MLTKYSIIVMVLFYISKGIGLEKSQDVDGVTYHVVGAVLMAPIFGRILGWW
jgi:hypothetical protein